MTVTTFDPAAKDASITLSDGDLTATTSAGATYRTAKVTQYKTAGQWYAEFTINTLGGLQIGLIDTTGATNTYMGGDADSYGINVSTGHKLHSGVDAAYMATCIAGDIVSVLWDADAGTLIFWKNGATQGTAYTGITGSWTFGISGGPSAVGVTANFGATAFAYTPGGAYTGFDSPLPPTPGDISATMQPMAFSASRVAALAGTMQSMMFAGGANGRVTGVMQPMTMSGSGGHNGAEFVMQPMTAALSGRSANAMALDMQPMTAAVTGYDSSINTASLTTPAPHLVCEVFAGEVITFEGTAPVPTFECGTKDARPTAPAPTLSATLLSGSVITVSARATAPVLVATLDNPAIIITSCIAAPPQLSVTLLAGNIVQAALAARAPTVSAQILTGNIATILAAAATPIMAAVGYPSYTITFAGTAPAPRLSATLSAAVTSAYRTWVLNTRKGALTEYSNFSFNSYAVFNGVTLACGPSGIVTLGAQDADGSTAIASTIKSGADNFGNSHIKRIPRIYIDYKTAGDAQFKMITVEGGSRTYSLNWNSVTGTQQRRIPVGKGPKSFRWQWEYTNIDGADFDINAVLAYPTATRRRVQ